ADEKKAVCREACGSSISIYQRRSAVQFFHAPPKIDNGVIPQRDACGFPCGCESFRPPTDTSSTFEYASAKKKLSDASSIRLIPFGNAWKSGYVVMIDFMDLIPSNFTKLDAPFPDPFNPASYVLVTVYGKIMGAK